MQRQKRLEQILHNYTRLILAHFINKGGGDGLQREEWVEGEEGQVDGDEEKWRGIKHYM